MKQIYYGTNRITYDIIETEINYDDTECITNLTFHQPKPIFLGDLNITGFMAVTGEQYKQLPLTQGVYQVYNVDSCILIHKTNSNKEIKDITFKFHELVYIDSDHTCGFFDYVKVDNLSSLDEDFDEDDEDKYMLSFKKLKSKNIHDGCPVKVSNFDLDTKINIPNEIIGYIINSDCGTVFPLQCLIDDDNENAVILTGEVVETLMKN